MGCGPHRIPGTDLEDNGDTRAIIDVISKYNFALEARDANGILALVDPSFHDNAGTLTPEDDIDIQRLHTVLPSGWRAPGHRGADRDQDHRREGRPGAARSTPGSRSLKLGGKAMTESDIKRMELQAHGRRLEDRQRRSESPSDASLDRLDVRPHHPPGAPLVDEGRLHRPLPEVHPARGPAQQEPTGEPHLAGPVDSACDSSIRASTIPPRSSSPSR